MPDMGDCPPKPVIDKEVEKTVLEKFLNEDTSMNETIDNLQQLLEKLKTTPAHTVHAETLLNIRRSLHSLVVLSSMMKL